MKNITITAANMAELTEKAFMDCLFKDGEDTTNHIKVVGITMNVRFHPQRLEEKRELVQELLNELPSEFKKGYSFLKLCTTKEGELWTGLHRICEFLVLMAIGLNLMEYCFPREIWEVLPGGVPYVSLIGE